jgi:hypothetical protein
VLQRKRTPSSAKSTIGSNRALLHAGQLASGRRMIVGWWLCDRGAAGPVEAFSIEVLIAYILGSFEREIMAIPSRLPGALLSNPAATAVRGQQCSVPESGRAIG